MEEKYYKAYEKRYTQVHSKNLSWASSNNSPIVFETLKKYFGDKSPGILDVGCGEGRDILFLLHKGYNVKGVDISKEAINFCRSKADEAEQYRFQTLDVCTQKLDEIFDYIYSVATLHMLVEDEDRIKYLSFIFEHLSTDGYGLILSMGDGEREMCSNIETAFENQKRIHQETGIELEIAATSCRTVSFETFEKELRNVGFTIVDKGITSIDTDFPEIMFAVVRRNNSI